jgi:hypothetical protein
MMQTTESWHGNDLRTHRRDHLCFAVSVRSSLYRFFVRTSAHEIGPSRTTSVLARARGRRVPYDSGMFPTPSSRKTFVVTCKRCRRDVPTGLRDFPSHSITVVPNGRRRRRRRRRSGFSRPRGAPHCRGRQATLGGPEERCRQIDATTARHGRDAPWPEAANEGQIGQVKRSPSLASRSDGGEAMRSFITRTSVIKDGYRKDVIYSETHVCDSGTNRSPALSPGGSSLRTRIRRSTSGAHSRVIPRSVLQRCVFDGRTLCQFRSLQGDLR